MGLDIKKVNGKGLNVLIAERCSKLGGLLMESGKGRKIVCSQEFDGVLQLMKVRACSSECISECSQGPP